MFSAKLTAAVLAFSIMLWILIPPNALGASGDSVAQGERYDNAGYRLSQWHRKSEAIVFYTAAVKANPSDFVAYFNRGCCYLEEHAYSKAVDDFNVALRLRPQDAGEIYGVRAIAWYGLGRDDECRADLDRATPRRQVTHPSIDELRLFLCESSAHPSSDERKRSLVYVDQAVSNARTSDEKARALNRRAWFFAMCRASTAHEIIQAIADASEACRLTNSKNAAFLDTLAAAYARQGDFGHAVEIEKNAIAKNHDRSDRPPYQRHLTTFQLHQSYNLTQADRP